MNVSSFTMPIFAAIAPLPAMKDFIGNSLTKVATSHVVAQTPLSISKTSSK
jgi:hypothetical protein